MSDAGSSRRTERPVDGSPLRNVSAVRATGRSESPSTASGATTTPVPVTRPASGGQAPGPSTTSAGAQNGRVAQPTRPVEQQQAPARVVSPSPAASAAAQAQAQARPASSRRVRLTVSRVDPWSAMKISFLLSVALGIAGVVMVSVLWTILNGMGVFDQVNGVVGQIIQDGNSRFDILDFVGFRRVVSLSIVIGVIDVILVTAIATLGAFLYNVSSALVGGLQVTLTDD